MMKVKTMENKGQYIATFRRCDKSKVYLNKMYHSWVDKMNFLILEMKTSAITTFRSVYISALAKEIMEAEEFVYIISGELSSNIWNSNAIVKAINNTKAKHIKILCGPEIDLNSIEVLKLVSSGKIDLYFTRKRYKKHFMLTEKTLFMEKGHRSFDFSDEILMTRRNASLIISYYKKKFEAKILFKKHLQAKDILEKFSPRVFTSDAKDNNKIPDQDKINEFLAEMGINQN